MKSHTSYSFLRFMFSAFLGLISCADHNVNLKPNQPVDSTLIALLDVDVMIKADRSLTDKSTYQANEPVRIESFSITNQSDTIISIEQLEIQIGSVSQVGNSILHRKIITDSLSLPSGSAYEIPSMEVWRLPNDISKNAYGIFLYYKLKEDTSRYLLSENAGQEYISFFRVLDPSDRRTFDIYRHNKEGLPVYKLSGGLSAEYAVQKSAASLNRGISHSWQDINPPLVSTSNFLQKSIDRTIDFYDRELGETSKIETVIISSGITPISYISRAMDAPVLPIHFLVGASTINEVQTILDFSNKNGIQSYATYGHDYSLSLNIGVAWIKLLQLPERYKDFLVKHQVENIVFFGATSSGGGEKAARQVINGVEHYGAGSIYLMYFAGTQAEVFLSNVIKDFDTEKLGKIVRIADWESGIIQDQIDNISNKIEQTATVSEQVLVTSSVDDIHLWNMASYAMLKLFSNNGIVPRGISLNPYLAGHPFYESFFGYVPFTYFNHPDFPLSWHTNRINGMMVSAFEEYFPHLELQSMQINAVTGTRSDFLQWFVDKGYANVASLENDDIWVENDGISSPSEVRTKEFLDAANSADIREWGDKLKYLSIQDLRSIAHAFPEITVTNE